MSVATAEITGRDSQNTRLRLPGQGSQYVGMGKALYEKSGAARRVFQQADEVLGFKLSKLCFEGPAEELEDTINAQPAILTVSLACLAAIREKLDAVGHSWQPPRFVAGHSLGEYTALVAAGALDFRRRAAAGARARSTDERTGRPSAGRHGGGDRSGSRLARDGLRASLGRDGLHRERGQRQLARAVRDLWRARGARPGRRADQGGRRTAGRSRCASASRRTRR